MQSLQYFMANYMLIFKTQQNFWSIRPLKKQKAGKDSHLSVEIERSWKNSNNYYNIFLHNAFFGWLNTRNISNK